MWFCGELDARANQILVRYQFQERKCCGKHRMMMRIRPLSNWPHSSSPESIESDTVGTWKRARLLTTSSLYHPFRHTGLQGHRCPEQEIRDIHEKYQENSRQDGRMSFSLHLAQHPQLRKSPRHGCLPKWRWECVCGRIQGTHGEKGKFHYEE